jgi:hypothetical protein
LSRPGYAIDALQAILDARNELIELLADLPLTPRTCSRQVDLGD